VLSAALWRVHWAKGAHPWGGAGMARQVALGASLDPPVVPVQCSPAPLCPGLGVRQSILSLTYRFWGPTPCNSLRDDCKEEASRGGCAHMHLRCSPPLLCASSCRLRNQRRKLHSYAAACTSAASVREVCWAPIRAPVLHQLKHALRNVIPSVNIQTTCPPLWRASYAGPRFALQPCHHICRRLTAGVNMS
jgi:hypothetical protein